MDPKKINNRATKVPVLETGEYDLKDPATTSKSIHGLSSNSLSEFYIACRYNDIGKVKKLVNIVSVEEMNRLEGSGTTALHVACYYGHVEVVRLLLQVHGLSRTMLNKYGCLAYDETANAEIKELFKTYPGSDRFVANSGKVEWLLVTPTVRETATHRHHILEEIGTKRSFTALTEKILEYYLEKYMRDIKGYNVIKSYFEEAITINDPTLLLKAYTAETGFYTRLNVHLAGNADEAKEERMSYVGIISYNPAFEKYSFIGIVFRGMRITEEDLAEYSVKSQIMTKSFLSTSKDVCVANRFAFKQNEQRNIDGKEVKFSCICTYKVQNPRTALNIADISLYPYEKEVLIIPYSVFTVISITKPEGEQQSVRINLEELIQN
ncbi:unnamed protein product [Adineta steineri]|uniref:NAD(P)(+)--arginine ADP-ribosyltransferase n=1 Tax=Adineta steineri TaxID=433720 RepID=A0A818IBB7_9BILA|nr:unnamed protein product [Adineta steineri]CAF1509406.1 unnamed protein product [Adineta steineri]CAF3501545.1 unnamed protein product [Adineta steineri]CAF3516854.1 unnamed protein product [Adineta steineri]